MAGKLKTPIIKQEVTNNEKNTRSFATPVGANAY
jgi:hypothetical protein